MSSKWTVTPETDRLDVEILGEQCWIEVKRDLTIGEQKRVDTSGFRGMTGFGKTDDEPGSIAEQERKQQTEISIDWRGQTFARTLTYLVDWSLADDKGNKLPCTGAAGRATIEALHQDVYAAIEKAINEHVERRTREKKVKSGTPTLVETSR